MKFRNYLFSLIATVLPNALGFFTFPFYAKILGASLYGVIALLEAHQSILSIFLLLGMGSSFYVFLSHAETEEQQKKIFANGAFFGFLAFIGSLLLIPFSPLIADFLSIDPSYHYCITIYTLFIFVDYNTALIVAYLRVKEQISTLAIHVILLGVIHRCLGLFAIILMGGGIKSYMAVFLSAKFLALGLFFGQAYWLRLPLGLKWIDFSLLCSMIKFGLPLIFTSLTGWVFLLSDRLFINYYADLTAVGVYAVLYKFSMSLTIGLVQPFMTVWEPSIFKVYIENAEKGYAKLHEDFRKFLGILVLSFSGFLLFIKNFLEFVFPKSKFSEDHQVLYLLIGSCFLMGIGEMLVTVCRLNKISKFAIWTACSAVGAKLAFNVMLIPGYLLWGAAASAFLSEIIEQTVMGFYAVRASKQWRLVFSWENFCLISCFLTILSTLYLFPELSLTAKAAIFSSMAAVILPFYFGELFFYGLSRFSSLKYARLRQPK